jgi:predicted dehydrogenase
MIRIAVVGLGFMGKTHLGIYNSLHNAEITALCDKSPDRVNLTSLDGGGNIDTSGGSVDFSDVQKYTDFDEMLDAGGFDAVDITLPTDTHVMFASKALKAGYHVFVEKPLALDYESAMLIAATAEESGKICSVGQCLRFWPLYTEVKKIIDSRQFGSIRHAEFGRYSPPATWAVEGWLGKSGRSGGASLDLHVHDVDMILNLFGKPRSVRSVGVPDGSGFFSHISTVYQYPDISVTSTGGWGFAPTFPFNMRALYVFEKATVEMDISKEHPVMVFPNKGEPYPLDLPEGDGYHFELIDFLERCESGEVSKDVSPSVAAESIRLVELEVQSAHEGREIALD